MNPPFSGSIVFQNDRTAPTATFENPFLGSPVAGGPAALVMIGQLRADKGNRPRYLNNDIWQWSIEVEKSFGQNFVIGAAYVGSAASNIDMPVQNANNPDPGIGPVQDRRPDPFYVDSREPEVLLPLGTVRRLETNVSTNYNALQMRAEKRMSKGLTFVASFNFQKGMGIGYGANEAGGFGTRQTQDPRNRLADYARSNIDQSFRFVFSNIYEFPWFRKERSLRGYVLGGWAVNGIIQLTSGLPVTVTQNGDSQNTGPAGAPRPHIVPGGKVDRVMEGRRVQRWFNTTAFVRSKCDGCPGEGVYLGPKGYGNAGAALFDAPAQKAWDFALFREFAIREKHHIQFRFEAFNFLNTPQFNAPDRTFGSVTFGQITSTALNNRELQFGLKYSF